MTDPPPAAQQRRPPVEEPGPGLTLDALWGRLHYQEARLRHIEERLAWVETQVAVQDRTPEGTDTP